MKNKAILWLCSISLLLATASCDVMKQMGGAYNMTQCNYSYRSLSNLNISGMDVSKGVSLSWLPSITGILSGTAKSVPLKFTLNLDVENPNQSAAMLHGLQYILSIDNVDFTNGTIDRSLNIPGGASQAMPLDIGFDIAELLRGESKDAVVSIVRNFIGIGDKASNVTFRIKPTFMIGTVPVTSPSYIPVTFAFGGKKN
ncbi:MAG: LEA type 2 family protein [Tannerellaceae bacterium]|jgi:LEA14-like dessication related protein|nr:LEA type 2 family protein [Tannerellaceae bacterium]